MQRRIFKAGRHTKTTDEHFVREYMAYYHDDGTADDVAFELSYASTASVYQRANRLRQEGVNLPYFGERNVTETQRLNSIILGQV